MHSKDCEIPFPVHLLQSIQVTTKLWPIYDFQLPSRVWSSLGIMTDLQTTGISSPEKMWVLEGGFYDITPLLSYLPSLWSPQTPAPKLSEISQPMSPELTALHPQNVLELLIGLHGNGAVWERSILSGYNSARRGAMSLAELFLVQAVLKITVQGQALAAFVNSIIVNAVYCLKDVQVFWGFCGLHCLVCRKQATY